MTEGAGRGWAGTQLPGHYVIYQDGAGGSEVGVRIVGRGMCGERVMERPGEESGKGCEMKRGAFLTHLLNPKVRGTRSGVVLNSEGSRVGVKRPLQVTRNRRRRPPTASRPAAHAPS